MRETTLRLDKGAGPQASCRTLFPASRFLLSKAAWYDRNLLIVVKLSLLNLRLLVFAVHPFVRTRVHPAC